MVFDDDEESRTLRRRMRKNWSKRELVVEDILEDVVRVEDVLDVD